MRDNHRGRHQARLERNHGRQADRRIRGVLHFAKKLGKEHVDNVCEVALKVGAPTYRFVKRYLEHHPPAQLTLRQVDPLIRQLTEYRDVVARLTKENA